MRFEQTGTALYGMKNAGKTTLGRGLADAMRQPFFDTDEQIRYQTGRNCPEIIKDPDLDFHAIQQFIIRGHKPKTPEVIAAGGSVATNQLIVEHLRAFTVGIFVKVEPDDLESRYTPEDLDALYNPNDLSFAELYAERMPAYEAAADYTLGVIPGESVHDTTERLVALRRHICA